MIDVLRRRSAAAVWLAALLGLVLVLGATSATAGAQQTLRASGKAQAAEHGKPGADAKAKAKQKAKAKAKKAKQKAKARAKARARARAEARARARAAAAAQASAQAQAQVQAPGAAGQTAGSTATAVANGSGSAGTPAAGSAEPAAETRPPLGAGLPSIGGCVRAVRFDAGSFPATPDIDNPLLPFVPGTQLVLQGRSNVTGALVDHTVTFTVTDLVKTVNGVSSLVIHDVDLSEGVKTEEELAFFAQDLAGNVWNLGEYPEEYEGGEFAGAPSTWIAGQQRAEPGIHMLAAPQVGGPRYLQGFVPRIRFFDCAQVIGAGQQVAVTGGTFDNVLVTDETNPLEPQSGSQQKYHAPGVGIVKVGFLDDPQAEELELVELNLLTPAELAVVRAAALALDTRAYEESAAVYEATSPARRL